MEVDRKQFENVVGNLLRTPAKTQAQDKMGQPNAPKIVPPRPKQ